MSDTKDVGDLEIEQDLQFQRRDWRAQRVGWIVMLLLILGTLAGAFGRGPLAHASAGNESAPLRVDYDRLVRHQADAELVLHLAAGAAAGRARILLDSALLEAIRIERFTPEPDSETATPAGVVFEFGVDSITAPFDIRLDHRATGYWRERGTIALGDHPPLQLDFFVYP
jgi:hypothetical protein